MSHLPGKFVWFELVSKDAKKAQAFYGEALGWKVEAFPMGDFTYEMVKAPSGTVGGYAPPKSDRAPSHWISYVSVADVDQTAKAAVAAGGKLVDAPFDVPGVGRMARIADPQGAELCLYRSADGDAADVAEAPAGTFCWNELHTSDPKKALAFYEQVFGYSHKDVDMGPAGTYHVLEKDGQMRGGVMTAEQGVPPMWLPYVAVSDTDQVAARAKKLGGKVHVEPADIPNVGRFAILGDPTGATIAVLKAAR
jgi:predicted enzyme related to lactoylglutathione lyase